MEHEIVNKETPEMKQLISGIKDVNKRLREIAQTHRPLFGEKSISRGERYANAFSSVLAPCKTIGTRALFPTPKSQEDTLQALRHQQSTARELPSKFGTLNFSFVKF